jgi:CDP-glucose 4,6-dehydratase
MLDISFYKNRRVFITGHTGFKGTWLCRILLHAGADVTGFSSGVPTSPSLFEQVGLEKEMRSITADIRNGEKLAKSVNEARADIVFHLAAQPLVRLSYREPVMTYETNVMGTVNVLEAVRLTSSVRSCVNVTTDKVYENNEWCWGYRENEKLCGLDPYSNSKSCSELATYSYRRSFFGGENAPAVSSARSGNVIGGGDYADDRIIPDCVRAASAGKEIIVRNPYSVRPYQHVLECLSGYLLLAEKQYGNKPIEGAYNFGPDSEGCVTTEKLVGLFCDAWGDGAKWRAQGENGPHEANFLKLDCAMAKAILGWHARWDIKTAIRKATEFAKVGTDIERLACIDKQINEYFGRESCLNP